MATLAEITGQSRVVEALRTRLASGRLHHAHLFEGPEGVGKRTTALALAAALNCDSNPDGCGVCTSCEKIATGNHPDVIVFDMTQKGLTERIRELLQQLSFAPHEGKARVIIFDPAENLAGQQMEAANALLKTLEEPPPRTFFVLVTAQGRKLPVTVRSRSESARFLPLTAGVLEPLLVKTHAIDTARARSLALEAEGSMAVAEAILAADGPSSYAQLDSLLAAATSGSVDKLLSTCAEVSQGQERGDLIAIVRALARTVRDALVPSAADMSVRPAAQLLQKHLSPSLCHALFRESERAIGLLIGNVAPQLVLENLFLPVCAASAPRSKKQAERSRPWQ